MYFKNEEAMEMLNVGKNKAVAMFKELENIGLIIRKKQGQGKPMRVYVMNFADVLEKASDIQTSSEGTEKEVLTPENQTSEKNSIKKEVLTPKNQTSRVLKMGSLPFFIENKTEKNKTNLSINQEKWEVSRKSDMIDGIDYNAHKCVAMEQIDFNRLSSEYGVEPVEEIVELMAFVYSTPQSSLPVSGVQTDIQLVRERFSRLEYEHIQYVLDCLMQAKTKINNRRSYLLTCLFSSPVTIDGYYANQVAHDLSSG